MSGLVSGREVVVVVVIVAAVLVWLGRWSKRSIGRRALFVVVAVGSLDGWHLFF
jgi:hypothetical protein